MSNAPSAAPRFAPPRFPFTGWPVQVTDARLGYLWHVAPNFFLNQTQIRHADANAANALHDWIDRLLAARRDEIAGAGGLVILHDWRSLEGYERDARRVFQARMRARPAGYLKTGYTIVPSTPLFRMAIEAAGLAAVLGSGGRVELGTDPEPILRRLRIAPPSAGMAFPG